MTSAAEAALVLGSYLLGSVPFALVLGKTQGVDIRDHGSGNVGATNLGRALGRRWAIAAFLLDFLKGLAPVMVAQLLLRDSDADSVARLPWIELEVCAAAIIGHVFPVWLRFKGGKGVATTFGGMTGLTPLAAVCAGAMWGLVFKATRTVSVASIAAGLSFPIAVWLTHFIEPDAPYLGKLSVAGAFAMLILVRHRTNLVRLVRGEELAFRRAKDTGPPEDKGSGEETGRETNE
jgi:glycerol-3-phosphate acyltransferase PlsY